MNARTKAMCTLLFGGTIVGVGIDVQVATIITLGASLILVSLIGIF
jgi:hypothetical protein